MAKAYIISDVTLKDNDAAKAYREAAAGTPNSVFRLTPADLVALTGGTVAAVKRQ